MQQTNVPGFAELPLTLADRRDLRSDHAGEHGAVAIYRGVLSVTRDPGVKRFARRHMLAETRHLRFFERFLPKREQSRLLGVWWLAGWMLGAGSAVFGARATYATVAAVERFVEGHYLEQIRSLQSRPGFESLVAVLEKFMRDEVHHRDDALRHATPGSTFVAQGWNWLVAGGSRVGVAIARRI
jgi:ubiquinone biosynthesis monooxygenase Coq7